MKRAFFFALALAALSAQAAAPVPPGCWGYGPASVICLKPIAPDCVQQLGGAFPGWVCRRPV